MPLAKMGGPWGNREEAQVAHVHPFVWQGSPARCREPRHESLCASACDGGPCSLDPPWASWLSVVIPRVLPYSVSCTSLQSVSAISCESPVVEDRALGPPGTDETPSSGTSGGGGGMRISVGGTVTGEGTGVGSNGPRVVRLRPRARGASGLGGTTGAGAVGTGGSGIRLAGSEAESGCPDGAPYGHAARYRLAQS